MLARTKEFLLVVSPPPCHIIPVYYSFYSTSHPFSWMSMPLMMLLQHSGSAFHGSVTLMASQIPFRVVDLWSGSANLRQWPLRWGVFKLMNFEKGMPPLLCSNLKQFHRPLVSICVPVSEVLGSSTVHHRAAMLAQEARLLPCAGLVLGYLYP